MLLTCHPAETGPASCALQPGRCTLHTSLRRSIDLSYLPGINKFGLPPSASCQVERNTTNEERLLLESFQRDVHLFFFLEVYNDVTLTK